MTARPLGDVQKRCLHRLVETGRWPGGWVWDTHKGTAKILDTLVKRGLAEHTDDGGFHGRYTPTDAGRAADAS